jgi:hypothetical protein
MTIEEFETYMRGLGFTVEVITGDDREAYTVVRSVAITRGGLRGRTCDVAMQRSQTAPFIPPAAIHTKPALVPMGTLSTQASPVGPDWQYWSRRLDRPVTPTNLWTHVNTILGEVA